MAGSKLVTWNLGTEQAKRKGMNMRMKFAIASIAIAVALIFTVGASQDGIAANMSPAQLGKMESSRIVEPAHCRAFRHCHRRWYRGRYIRYCHRCG